MIQRDTLNSEYFPRVIKFLLQVLIFTYEITTILVIA